MARKNKIAEALAKHVMATALSSDGLAFSKMRKSTRDFILRALTLVESTSEETSRHAETKADKRAAARSLAEAKRLHSVFSTSNAIRRKA
jgi:hypothetical protein